MMSGPAQLESLKEEKRGPLKGFCQEMAFRPKVNSHSSLQLTLHVSDCPALSHYTNQSLFSWSAVALQCCQFPLQAHMPLSLTSFPFRPPPEHWVRVTYHAQSRACQSPTSPNSSHAPPSPWYPHVFSTSASVSPYKPINVTPTSLSENTHIYRFYFPIHL